MKRRQAKAAAANVYGLLVHKMVSGGLASETPFHATTASVLSVSCCSCGALRPDRAALFESDVGSDPGVELTSAKNRKHLHVINRQNHRSERTR